MRGDFVIVNVTVLENYRKAQGITRTRLSDVLDINRITGARIWNGQRVTLKIARKIAEGIGCELAEIIPSWGDGVCEVLKGCNAAAGRSGSDGTL